jgi:hypothetical protein
MFIKPPIITHQNDTTATNADHIPPLLLLLATPAANPE